MKKFNEWRSHFSKTIAIIAVFFAIYLLSLSLVASYALSFYKKYIYFIDIGALTLASLFLLLCFRKELKEKIKPFLQNFRKDMPKYLKWYVIAWGVMLVLNILLYFIVGNPATNEEMNEQLISTNPIYSFMMSLILAPFYEEVLFRLNFKNLFKKKWTFALFTGILFGSMHLLVATSWIEMLYVFPYAAMGIMLGFVFIDKENIYNSMFIHFLNNLIAFLITI